jgi:type II secretory pathway component GspD/PulD (secretin)
MLSQSAQLAAAPGTNKLVIVDRYDNVRRITAVIEELTKDLED